MKIKVEAKNDWHEYPTEKPPKKRELYLIAYFSCFDDDNMLRYRTLEYCGTEITGNGWNIKSPIDVIAWKGIDPVIYTENRNES